jgi:hypothetical protein
MDLLTAQQLELAFRQLGWSDCCGELALAIVGDRPTGDARSTDPCLLRRLLGLHESQPSVLTSTGVHAISRLVAKGLTLRERWPRMWSQSIDRWLGQRLYLSHANNFARATRLTSIVSSNIGRHGRQLPEWPELANSVLRDIYRRGDKLLIAPGSTHSESLREFSDVAGIPNVLVEWAREGDLGTWLDKRLHELSTDSEAVVDMRHRLELSPAIGAVDSLFASMPLQDRAAIAISDTVHTLAVRPRGKISQLLDARLRDGSFPTASVYIALGRHHRGRSATAHVRWLDHGAVGWLATFWDTESSRSEQHPWLIGCRQPPVGVATQQVCGPLPERWGKLQATDDWPFLVHCTRRGAGPLPEECLPRYRSRLWLEGKVIELPPLETLSRICWERLLRGSSTITRTTACCVSFSAVPLVPLLRRRTFRSQLSRWDWEPYGLLIDRESLSTLGAKPVIYGKETDYAKLGEAERAFFQPFGKSHRSSGEDWSAEREWRMIGDLRLDQLPANCVSVFVKHRCEAMQLSRRCPWPVLWIDG